MSFGKLLKFEFAKLKNLKIGYAMLALSAVLVFIVWRGYRTSMLEYGFTRMLSTFILEATESAYIPLFLALFVSIFNCQDGTEDTLKTIRAKGYSFVKIYFTQLVVTYVVMLAYFVLVVAFAVLMGFAGGFERSGETYKLARALALRLYCIVALTAFYTFFATLIRKTGGALAVNVVSYAVGFLIFALIDVIMLKIAKDVFTVNGEDIAFRFTDYWILEFYSAAADFTLNGSEIAKIIVGSSVYLLTGAGGGYLLSIKKEIR